MILVKEEGAKWSSEREKAIQNDEYTPNDILQHTLRLQGNFKFISMSARVLKARFSVQGCN